MTLKQYLGVMGGGTALAWAMLALVIFTVDPEKTQIAVFGVFYAILLLALIGSLSLIGFGLRTWIFGQERVLATQVAIAFRQAVLLSILIIVALLLERRGARVSSSASARILCFRFVSPM